jgi:hypothetical protein
MEKIPGTFDIKLYHTAGLKELHEAVTLSITSGAAP